MSFKLKAEVQAAVAKIKAAMPTEAEINQRVALLTMGTMQDQADQGMGKDKKLRAYSGGYAALRKAAGLSSMTNLYLSGAMLKSLQVIRDGKDALVIFAGNSPVAQLVKKKGSVSVKRTGESISNAFKAWSLKTRNFDFVGIGRVSSKQIGRDAMTWIAQRLKEKL